MTVVGQRNNYTISVVNGYGNVTLDPLPAGEYVVRGVFGETEYYLKSDDGAKIVVSRYPSNLVIFDVEGMVGNYFKLVANVTGVDKYPVNGTVKVIGHKSNYTINIVNGAGFTLINALEAGTFIVEGVFAETDYYLKSGDNATIIISKYSSNLEINIDDIEVGEPLVIKVKVTGNATVIPNGTVTVTINHKDYVINLTGGEGNVSIENLPANYYVVSGIYSGDSIYDNAEGFANVTISKHPSQLIIESSNIKVGDKEIINLTVVDMNNTPVNANGYAIVQGMRGEYNITIVNGKGNRTFDDLPAGHYILTGIFYGGPIYAKSENNARTEFDVTKYQSTITININDTKVDELVFAEVIVSEGGSGNVSLTLAGKEYNLTVGNGKGYINLTRLSVVNTYIVTGIYYGDNHYSKSEGTTSFKVEKYPSNVEIILDNETYHSGEQINVLVKVTDGATGNVTLTVGNLTKTVILNGGVGTWNISSLPNGLYSIAALYNGDYKYRTSGSSKQFSVNATAGMDVTINVTINASAENIRIGDAVYVNINITGDYGIPTGNVTVLISGLTYPGVLNQNGTVTVAIPGLEARDYVAIITYSGDDVYSSNSTQIQFTVLKWDSQVNVTVESIYVLDLANVTVAVTDGATGNVSVILNRQTYNIELVNGKGSKLIPNLPASDEEYLVEVTYLGDNSYQKSENHTSFRVNKYKPSVLVDVQNIYVGQDVNITIKITGNASVNATGEATFVLDGKNYTVAIVNGTGNISVSGLKGNNYNVPVIYYGDAVYLKGEGNGAFKVSKYDSKMVIDVDPIYVGENLTINITIEGVPGINASGKVDIFIGGKHYDVEIINGKGSIDNITNLTVGKHDFTVTYYGDDNYTKTDAGSSAIVNAHMPTIKINVTDIKVGETEFVNVTVVGVDGVVPSGQIQILVNNHDEVVTLNENGTAIIPISDLAASDEPYILEAIYYGDDYYAKGTGKGSFNVTRFDSSVSVVVGDIKVGETEFVNVTCW